MESKNRMDFNGMLSESNIIENIDNVFSLDREVNKIYEFINSLSLKNDLPFNSIKAQKSESEYLSISLKNILVRENFTKYIELETEVMDTEEDSLGKFLLKIVIKNIDINFNFRDLELINKDGKYLLVNTYSKIYYEINEADYNICNNLVENCIMLKQNELIALYNNIMTSSLEEYVSDMMISNN